MNSNAAFDRPVSVEQSVAGCALAPTAVAAQSPVRRLSPLASLILLTTLSLGAWAGIWRGLTWLLAG